MKFPDCQKNNNFADKVGDKTFRYSTNIARRTLSPSVTENFIAKIQVLIPTSCRERFPSEKII